MLSKVYRKIYIFHSWLAIVAWKTTIFYCLITFTLIFLLMFYI